MDRPSVPTNGERGTVVTTQSPVAQNGEASGLAQSERTMTEATDIIEALAHMELLRGLSDAEYRWLAEHGSERSSTGRTVVFRENEPAHHMLILLRGEIYVHRRNSGSVILTIGRTAQITGKLPYSRMQRWGGEGCSSDSPWLLEIHESLFAEMILAIPSMTQRCVSILLDRTSHHGVTGPVALTVG